jgi:hypothetical protein
VCTLTSSKTNSVKIPGMFREADMSPEDPY